MRTAFQPHLRRALGCLIVGVLASCVFAQQPLEVIPVPTAPGVPQPVGVRPNQLPEAPIRVMPSPPTSGSATTSDAKTADHATTSANQAPIIHALTFPAPALHLLDVQSAFPTDGQASIELMMAKWTPGFYRLDDYARDVQNFIAYTLTGDRLKVEKPASNRWRIETKGEPVVMVSYRLACDTERPSVVRNVVTENYAVVCGGPTFTTLVDQLDRPHEVQLSLPTQWARSATGLPPSPDSYVHHYRARNFDQLIDSPIAVGKLSINEFRVAGARHFLVDIAAPADLVNWNGRRKADELQKMVQETYNFWGFVPFTEYYFLNKLGSSRGGGLEHMNSTLFHTAAPRAAEQPSTRLTWLQFVAHEYFHAYNVKRLRPAELVPIDYENARNTSGLWVAEGLTNYFNTLIVARSGLCSPLEYLAELSEHIHKLQTTPGRLKQSLAAASLDAWLGEGFGGNGPAETTISYYTKGPVVGFILDAKIRRATNSRKSLDDVMRLAYERYSGPVGYSEQQFLDTCSEVAAMDLNPFFTKALFSTEELDYAEALDWFGLRFRAPAEGGEPTWQLEVLPNASEEQQRRMVSYLSSSKAPSLIAASAPPAVLQAPRASTPTQPPANRTQPTPTTPPPANQPPATPPQTTPPPATQTAPPQPAAANRSPQLVEGLGGVFIYSNDADRLAEWYQKQLGFEGQKMAGDGAFVFAFRYRRSDDPNATTETVWAILPTMDPRTANPPQYSLNYRVPNMARMLAHLRENGVEIEKTEEHAYGKFAWVRDPDGNRVELFEKAGP
jgi:predicted metalloprotease with PDZ domain/catechol 2,3-dioxygenase-like lactoylglutathione lyase family enzyme